MKKIVYLFILLFITSICSAQVFNKKLTDNEKQLLNSGELLIKNINYKKNMCLIINDNNLSSELYNTIDKLNPKYLAEVIQYKPYEGNEDLPQRLEDILNNVPDYAGIPYYSVRGDQWYDLYESAEIKETYVEDNKKIIKADLVMAPFDVVNEEITILQSSEEILYTAKNTNLLRYLDKLDCVWPEKMKICIYLFRDGDNWVLYGIGGVNAPRIPFLIDRIQTSFINRINTFCSFIFKKF